jgi:hypothetical protein
MTAEIPDHWVHEETLGPREVAKIFNVDSRTITKWASNGIIGFFRTPSGVRRYPACEVKRIMAGDPPPEFLVELAELDKQKYHDKWVGGWRRSDKAFKAKGDKE